VSRKISLDFLAFAVSSNETEPRRKAVWRWLGIGVLSVFVLALFAPASWAQTVTVNVSGTAMPNNVLVLTASVDGGATPIDTINWTQIGGAEASISSATSNPTSVTLGDQEAFKAELIHVLSEPPIEAEDLPPNVPLPEGEFPGGLQSRYQVLPANPLALEEAGLVTIMVEVTTAAGPAEAEVEIHTELPWKVKNESLNVATGIPVILHGKDDQGPYNWALRYRPWGSSATLTEATSQNPEFTPDLSGRYIVTVTDTSVPKMVRFDIYAGTWVGAITGQDADGRPLAGNCTPCHREAGRAPDVFTPWAQTGHAEIFTNNLNTSTHYGDSCFACHLVGYDLDAFNFGADDTNEYQDFLTAGLLNNPGDNWTTVLADYPNFARRDNIQCENCHGPNTSGAHNPRRPKDALTGLDPRVDISANTCAVCHGEPLRHARFQQWQLSKHADYELAVDEGESGNCSRCHTANGFLTWVDILLDDNPATDPTASITVNWTEDKIHPQTCPVCHDPHMIGTTTGNNTDATTRVSDDTPLLTAGFKAFGVGRGAMCMTCHNSRRGQRNENTYAETLADNDIARAPHGGVQTDLLMGQNAYFVDLGTTVPGEDFPQGIPAGHANQTPAADLNRRLTDTCATCHMVKTPPPDLLAYNLGGTNHTFFASEDICADCHDGLINIDTVQSQIGPKLDTLEASIVAAIQAIMEQQIALGNSIDLNGAATIKSDCAGAADCYTVAEIAEMEFGETHGRQAIAITFTDATALELERVTDVDVVDAGGNVLGQLYDFRADDNLPKAGWNYNLVHNDESLGVHNFFFAANILDLAIAALP
jgi:hypothetical protein